MAMMIVNCADRTAIVCVDRLMRQPNSLSTRESLVQIGFRVRSGEVAILNFNECVDKFR